MNDYEVKEVKRVKKAFCRIPGASQQLASDIHAAIEEGVSYGTYIWRKLEKKQIENSNKHGRRCAKP